MKNATKKLTKIVMSLSLLLSYILPVTPVFAATSRTVNVTSTNIISLVKFEKEGFSKSCITTPDDQGMDKCPMTFENDSNTYTVTISPDFFTGGRIESIKINGETKTVTSPTGDNTYTVSAATEYNIEVVGVQEQRYSVMWANDGANVAGTDYDSEEIMLKNGSAKVVKVLDNITDKNDITNDFDHIEEGCVDPNGRGFIQVAEGNVIVFEFTPKYGYQLTSVTANGTVLEPQEEINQYMYIMPATQIHFQATFTKTSDIVKSSTDKVTGGTIKIGKNEIDAGSTVLKVSEASLEDGQMEEFTSRAGDYKVSNVFDIKLDQVFYKGSTDKNNVWSLPLGYNEDLNTPAIITLKLDEGVDGNEVVLIHEKEDGTYETIKTTYDEKTHTISFSTSSFSNYAIASKMVDNPNTIDNFNLYLLTSLISLLGLLVVFKIKK